MHPTQTSLTPNTSAAPLQPDGHLRIVSMSIVRNEQDIIEPFIRHNSRLVDQMLIVDNNSVDDTRRIIAECSRELPNVVFADSYIWGWTQSAQMTAMMRHVQNAFFPDFLVPLDADEFLSAASPESLRRSLCDIPQGGIGYVPWVTHVHTPAAVKTAKNDPPRTMLYRRSRENPQYYKVILRTDRRCAPSWVIAQGNHSASCNSGRPLPSATLGDLSLLHFPVRSERQIMTKAALGWLSYLAKDPRAALASEGYQKRKVFEALVGDHPGRETLGEHSLCELSVLYAQEDRPVDWSNDVRPGRPPADLLRRYSTAEFGDPLTLAARSWSRSLTNSHPLTLDTTRPAVASLGQASAASTAFDSEWGWDNLFVDVAPFRFIAEKHLPKRVLDVGCGIGANLEIFRQFAGSSVLGIDGVPEDSVLLQNNEYIFHDLATPPPLGEMFDMVVCTEVLEHLPPEAADHLLDWITRRAANTIVFSAAEPGQPGHQHINCRPIDHWLDLLAKRGWSPQLTDTLGMRALSSLSWFRRNLVVLQPTGNTDGELAARELKAVAQRPFRWYNQQPGIRQAPFTETVPDNCGYQ